MGFSGKLSGTVCRNKLSALSNPKVVDEYVQKRIFPWPHGRPICKKPFPEFMCSPIGCVPRTNGEWRLILDVSAPADVSVDDSIARENFSVRNVKFDAILSMVMKHGHGALLAKVDLKHAFRLCPVRHQD